MDDASPLIKSFHWAAVCIRTLLARFGQGILNTGLCQAAHFSSHCSGCGAAEISYLGVMISVQCMLILMFLECALYKNEVIELVKGIIDGVFLDSEQLR